MIVYVEVCVGSSCHLHGSEAIVERMQRAIEERHLEDDIILLGSFCTGNCNQKGVTIKVDDDVYVAVTPEGFDRFFEEHIASRVRD